MGGVSRPKAKPPSYHMDCIFCKIVNYEIPGEIIYEDEKIMAFLDLHPAVKGHALLIPKVHCENFLALPDDLITYLFHRAKEIAPAIMKGSHADGFNIGINNGSSAGQVIFHCHIHLIPRHQNDGLTNWQGSDYAEGEMKFFGEEIRKYL